MKKKILDIILTVYFVLFIIYYLTTGGHNGNNIISTFDEFSEFAASLMIIIPLLIYLMALNFKKYFIDLVYFIILFVSIEVYEGANLIYRANYHLEDFYAYVTLIFAVYAMLHIALEYFNVVKLTKYLMLNIFYVGTMLIVYIVMFYSSTFFVDTFISNF